METTTRAIYDLRASKSDFDQARARTLLDELSLRWGERAVVLRATVHLTKNLCCHDVAYALSILNEAANRGNSRAKAFLAFLPGLGAQIFNATPQEVAQIGLVVPPDRVSSLLIQAIDENDGFGLILFDDFCKRPHKQRPPKCEGVDKSSLASRAASGGFGPGATDLSVISMRSGQLDDAERWALRARALGDLSGSYIAYSVGARKAMLLTEKRSPTKEESKEFDKYYGYLVEAAYGCVAEAEQALTDLYLKAAPGDLLANRKEVVLWHALSTARGRPWAVAVGDRFGIASMSIEVSAIVQELAPCPLNVLWLY